VILVNARSDEAPVKAQGHCAGQRWPVAARRRRAAPRRRCRWRPPSWATPPTKPGADRPAAGAAAAAAGADPPRGGRAAAARPAPRARHARGARAGRAPPPAAALLAEIEKRVNDENAAPRSATSAPPRAKRSTRCTTTAAPPHRGAWHPRLSPRPGPQALRRAHDERHRRRRRPRDRSRDRAPVQVTPAGPAAPWPSCSAASPFGPFSSAMRARPTRSWSPRASASPATTGWKPRSAPGLEDAPLTADRSLRRARQPCGAQPLSPFIHASLPSRPGRPWTTAAAVPHGRLCRHGARFAAEGGRGCNVTVPFKFEVPPWPSACSPRATLAGAANVLRFDADGWLADNTDGVGLVRDIEQARRRAAGRQARAADRRRRRRRRRAGAAAGARTRRAWWWPTARRQGARPAGAERHAAWAGSMACGWWRRRWPNRRGLRRGDQRQRQQPGRRGVPVPDSGAAPGALAVDLMYGPAAQPFWTGRGCPRRTAPATAWACWWSRRPRPLCCGAACAATAPVLAALRAQLAAEADRG
jgi:shikimate dehydrogenase